MSSYQYIPRGDGLTTGTRYDPSKIDTKNQIRSRHDNDNRALLTPDEQLARRDNARLGKRVAPLSIHGGRRSRRYRKGKKSRKCVSMKNRRRSSRRSLGYY